MIYTKEAHADDIWPVGYGINSTKSLEERVSHCDDLIRKYPDLFKLVDNVFIDTMNNDFTETTGAWPEGYILADPTGVALFKSYFNMKGVYSLFDVYKATWDHGFTLKYWTVKWEEELEQYKKDGLKEPGEHPDFYHPWN